MQCVCVTVAVCVCDAACVFVCVKCLPCSYVQGLLEPYIHSVCTLYLPNFPTNIRSYTLCIHGPGQPQLCDVCAKAQRSNPPRQQGSFVYQHDNRVQAFQSTATTGFQLSNPPGFQRSNPPRQQGSSFPIHQGSSVPIHRDNRVPLCISTTTGFYCVSARQQGSIVYQHDNRVPLCISTQVHCSCKTCSVLLTGRVGQNHIYTMYIRYFRQGNHKIYGHIQFWPTLLAGNITTDTQVRV